MLRRYITGRFSAVIGTTQGCQLVNRKQPHIVPCIAGAHTSSRKDQTKPALAYERPHMYEFKNGNKMLNIFGEREYEQRLSELRKYMAFNDIAACVFTSFHNINYYSGFIYCAFGRNYAHVVSADKCTTVAASIDGGQPWRRSHSDETILYTDWHQDNFFKAVQSCLIGVSGKIGFEFDDVNLLDEAKYKQALPRNELVDVGFPTMQMRMYKSPAELEVIRHGARIADIGGYAGVEAMRDDAAEYQVARHATNAMVEEIAKTYPQSDIMDTWTWFLSGINTDGAHNPISTKKMKAGEILSLNCFPMIQGYYTALERTLFLDHVSDAHLRLWQINCEVHKKGNELIRPGVRCCDIVDELNEIYRKYNLLQYRSFGYGHSFGTLSHYYGREAGLELREDITTVLQPGMVVSMEPMISIPEGQPGAGGYREHDIHIITEHGSENITGFPYGPGFNIIQK